MRTNHFMTERGAMEKAYFEIKAVTPIFSSGADFGNKPEFRSASIKGLLRFWYRAIYPLNSQNDEARIFGCTGGRSPFSLKAMVIDPLYGGKGETIWDGNPISYLGYGVIQRDKDLKKNITTRAYFSPGSTFRLIFTFHDHIKTEDKIRVLRSFWALSMLGGIGSRNRRGFGSFKIISNDLHSNPDVPPFIFENEKEYIKFLQAFLNSSDNDTTGKPQYTCFSNNKRIVLKLVPSAYHLKLKCPSNFKGSEKAMAVLEKIADDFNNFRSAKKSDHFKTDHDLMLNFLKGGKTTSAPKRAAFGLPHNYFFSSTKMSGNVDLLENGGKGRRASPLLIHVQEFSDSSACGVLTFLPAELLPSGKTLTLSGGNNKSTSVPAPDFSAITQFMDNVRKIGGKS